MNLLFTDYETTGLDPNVHEIIEMGSVLCDADTLEIISEFSEKVRPLRPELASPMALAVNGYNELGWANADSLLEVLVRWEHIANQAVFVASPVTFDYGFYQAALEKTGRKSNMNYHRLDVGSMAFPLIQPYQLSLEKLCLVLGIQPEPAPHRAINGAMREYLVVKTLRMMAQEGKNIINPECFLEAA